MEKKRVISLDVLRIISCFGVVLRHVCSVYWSELPVNSLQWQCICLFDSLFIFAVPVFVMISGALFLAPEKEISLKKLLTRNVLRMFTSFIFWSGLGAIRLQHVYRGAGATDMTNARTFILDTLFSSTTLGFLCCLIGLYLMIPFLRKIAQEKKLVEYFLILAFIFVSCLAFLCFVPFFGEVLYEKANAFRDRLMVNFITGYTGFFLLGHYLYQYDFKRWQKNTLYALAVLSQAWVTVYAAYVSYRTGVPDQSSFGYVLPTTCFISAGLFLWCKDHLKGIGGMPAKIIRELGICSFGVYLTHGLMLNIATDAGLIPWSINAAAAAPLQAVIIFELGTVIAMVLRRIPVVNRYLI